MRGPSPSKDVRLPPLAAIQAFEAAARLDDAELARFVRTLASGPARLVARHRSRGFGPQEPAAEIGLA